jgi:hypothetical protein
LFLTAQREGSIGPLVDRVLDPVQLGIEGRVAGFLPGLGPLERHASAREQAAQGLTADAYRTDDLLRRWSASLRIDQRVKGLPGLVGRVVALCVSLRTLTGSAIATLLAPIEPVVTSRRRTVQSTPTR